VVDGDFKADHMKMRTDKDVRLTDGERHFVEDAPYQEHLKNAEETRTKQVCL